MSKETILRSDPQEQFRLGVFGCLGQGEPLIAAAKELGGIGVEVVAIADPDVEWARCVAGVYGIPAAYASLEKMIEQCRLDGAVVATPGTDRLDAVTYALGHGMHVVCGEPFGRDATEARSMIEAARRVGRVLAAGYEHPVQAAWSLGNFGRATGPVEEVSVYMASVRGSKRAIPGGSDFWERGNSEGAGAYLGAYLPAALELLGSPPVSVIASTSDHNLMPLTSLVGIQGPDGTHSMRVVGANGARAFFTVVWGDSPGKDRRFIACEGPDGLIQVPLPVDRPDADDVESFRPSLYGSDGEKVLELPPIPTERALVFQTGNWVAACRGEQSEFSRPEFGLMAHRVLEAAERAARSRGEIEL
jgi:predicted dehydrogenase